MRRSAYDENIAGADNAHTGRRLMKTLRLTDKATGTSEMNAAREAELYQSQQCEGRKPVVLLGALSGLAPP